MNWEEGSYQKLCKTIKDSIEEVSYCALSSYRTIIVLGISNFRSFEDFITSLQEVNPSISIIMITQTHKIETYKNYLGENHKFIEWNQNFSLDLLNELNKDMKVFEADAMIYFAKTPDDLGSLNILELGRAMSFSQSISRDFAVYCVDSVGGKLYGYPQLSLTYRGLRLYQAINDYLMEL